MEIRYSTTRSEIMAWYFKRLKMKLWKFHLLVLLVLLLGNAPGYLSGSVPLGTYLAKSLAWGFFASAFMFLYPILRHKSEERVLTIGADGIETRIGKRSGSVPWKQIESVDDVDGSICIAGKNQNGFVIPGRAFNDDKSRKDFLEYVRRSIGK